MKEVFNYMEILVEEQLNSVVNSDETDFCTCEQCKRDIYALALNNVQPFYVVTAKGKIMARYAEQISQLDTDVLIAITNAIEKVKANPYHATNGELY